MSRDFSEMLDGLWQSCGYGLFAEISGGEVQMIEHTKMSCPPTTRLPIDRFAFDFNMTVDSRAETFDINHDGTLSTITFERRKGEPFASCCPSGLMGDSHDPALNFDVPLAYLR